MSELLKINVNDKVEKKNGLTYLSWAWAWAEVLKIDPKATWNLMTFGQSGNVLFFPDGSAMVGVAVYIKEHGKSAVLPVMNHRNQAIKNPDAFAINTAIQRCLAKAIAMHGLGLYIYAGEDLPEGEEAPKPAAPQKAFSAPHKATDGALEALPKDQQEYIRELAEDVVSVMKESGAGEAYERVQIEQLDNDQMVALWSLLDSKTRSALKTEKGARMAAA